MYLHWLQQRGDCTFKIHTAMLSSLDWTLRTVATRGWTFFSFHTQATGCEMWLVVGYRQRLSSASTQALKSPPFCQLQHWLATTPRQIRGTRRGIAEDPSLLGSYVVATGYYSLPKTAWYPESPESLAYDTRTIPALKESRLNHGFA
jgi:hypothetical protein